MLHRQRLSPEAAPTPGSGCAGLVVRAMLGCAVVLGCSEDSVLSEPCPRDVPAFRVQFVAPDGSLPTETTLTVMFGGAGVESYSVEEGNEDNRTLCCRPGDVLDDDFPSVSCDESGLSESDGGLAAAIHCEMWTDGAATVEVEAPGYAPLEETLVAELDEDEDLEECSMLITREVEVVLASRDAGVRQ